MLKIGIIGSGFGLYGLLPAFSSIKDCRVVCICGKKTPRLENYCNSIGLKNIYTDWQLMLEREDLDAVAIAVTPDAQYLIAKAAIKKGLHVFAEKPLAANLKQAKELFILAKKHKVVTAVDFIFPEINEWAKVKQLLYKKKFGKLKHVSVAWDFLSFDIKNKLASWKTSPKQGGGALAFYFSHVLYNLEYFAGQITSLKSLLSYSKESLNGGEAGVDAILKFNNGITGSAHLNCNAKGLNRHQLQFVCERATIILENKDSTTRNFNVKIFSGNKTKQLNFLPGEQLKKGDDERVEAVKKIASRFIKGCIGKKSLTPSFKDGLRVQQLIQEIRDSQL